MLAAAVSRLCPVAYEPDLGGPRRGDLLLMPDGLGPPSPGCLVEIAAISDESANEANPVDVTRSEIYKAVRKLQCPLRGWHLQVEGDTEGDYGDAKLKLHLGTGRTADVLDGAFFSFLRQVREAPGQRHAHRWSGERLDMTLTFDPDERGASGGNPSYTVVHSLRRNPLANALVEKSSQLAQTGHPGPYGVVVCDAGCQVLSSRNVPSSFSVRDILTEFFRRDRRLSFVLIVSVETMWSSPWARPPFRHVMRTSPAVREGAPALATSALARLVEAVQSLPAVVDSPANAARCYRRKWENWGWVFPGGSITMTIPPRTVRFSARALLEMLAGRKSPDDLAAAYSRRNEEWKNPFKQLFMDGRLIKRAEVIRGPNDEDEIELTFGPPDPAASLFRVPETRE
ncbi:MAG: hypothetical protein KF869_06460 [Phycisphaeraceae bacterium]|nr:hypothetical protein [Phycisphaeraceae bacterium]